MANANETLYKPLAISAATNAGVSPDIFASLIQSESDFNPMALGKPTSSGQALGIAQFMPPTALQYGVSNPFDAQSALDGSARMLSELVNKFGNYRDAISYYKGYGNNLPGGYGKADSVLNNAGYAVDTNGSVVSANANTPAMEAVKASMVNTKPLWQWGMGDIKNWFADSAPAFTIGLFAIVIIIAGGAMLLRSGGISSDDLIKGIKK